MKGFLKFLMLVIIVAVVVAVGIFLTKDNSAVNNEGNDLSGDSVVSGEVVEDVTSGDEVVSGEVVESVSGEATETEDIVSGEVAVSGEELNNEAE